jgi:polyisoprenoid-binding protein YceI
LLPSGAYKLDPAHASLVFHVSHLGFSNFTSRFSTFEATLTLDQKHPSNSSVRATIDPRSIEIYHSSLGSILQAPEWFHSVKFPFMTFRSVRVDATGRDTARVAGAMTFRGVTRLVVLNVRFNGGYAANPLDPLGARVGFSARGVLKRSAFGMTTGLPAAGSTMGVGDDVSFEIEAEFTKAAATLVR